jgi:cell division protease FtsH
VAEELIYQEVSTGARDDLMKATDIAKNMVKTYGMSETLGQMSFDQDSQPTFLQTGQAYPPGDYSEQTAHAIDCEVRQTIDAQYVRARELLGTRQELLQKAAAVLLQKEVISGEELRTLATQSSSDQGKTWGASPATNGTGNGNSVKEDVAAG